MISFSNPQDEYGWLSNYYPCRVEYKGLVYSSSEAAYQSMKTKDLTIRKQFTEYDADTSKQKAKKLFVRPDWNKIRTDVMLEIVYEKFKQNPDLASKLLDTGDELLMELTTGWCDNFWGNCLCPKCKNVVGRNFLGRSLMKVRDKLRERG